ncbi:MAG: hypothetical protein CMM28_04455 [Rhodospirillaceae bacterium]|nr:hypothetical protein [Rhodospirillaceae bacterium]|tara:strand:+ start:340 stop:576 length:237 start_codon:yes stop_codon:yes gene_type:complete
MIRPSTILLFLSKALDEAVARDTKRARQSPETPNQLFFNILIIKDKNNNDYIKIMGDFIARELFLRAEKFFVSMVVKE